MKFIRTESERDLHLENVRLIYNGAEPSSLDLYNKFLNKMDNNGIHRNVMYPVYGLGEGTTAVTFPCPISKGRDGLSLTYDVLIKAIKTIPDSQLSEELKAVFTPNFKKETLYKTKPSQSDSKMDQLLKLCLVEHILKASAAGKGRTEALRIIQRFIKEQIYSDEHAKRIKAKSNKEISANSLQSAYEEDCTFRNKNGKSQSGYVLNLAETCAKENPI